MSKAPIVEPAFDPANLPTEEEIKEEIGDRLKKYILEYQVITDADYRPTWMLFPVNSPQRQQVAEQIARYFHRESQYDFPPYSAGDEGPERPVYLIPSKHIGSLVPVIAGAAGFTLVDGIAVLRWVWLHPWERGGDLTQATFTAFDRLYGEFKIEGPTSKPMKGLMKKRGYTGREVYFR